MCSAIRSLFGSVLEAAELTEGKAREIAPWHFLGYLDEAIARIKSGASLDDVLDGLCIEVERLVPPALCAVSLVEHGELRLSGAPSLPTDFKSAIDNIDIGPSAELHCYAEPVYITDITTDPRWGEHRRQALSAGLRSCWCQPLLGESGNLIGTVSLYARQPKSPDPEDKLLLAGTAIIARIAVEYFNNACALQGAELALHRSQRELISNDGRVKQAQFFLNHSLSEFEGVLHKVADSNGALDLDQKPIIGAINKRLRAIADISESLITKGQREDGDQIDIEQVIAIKDNAQFALNIFDNLIQRTNPKSAPEKLLKKHTDLHLLYDVCRRFLRHQSAGLEIHIDIDPNVSPIYVDTAKFQRAFLELIMHISADLPRSGALIFCAHRGEDQDVLLSIIYRPASSAVIIAEPHIRANAFISEAQPGELHYARSIIEAHGGTLTLQRNAVGLVTWVRLPSALEAVTPQRRN